MGKNYSKQPLSQDELFKIYNRYKASNNARVSKSKKFLEVDLVNDGQMHCMSCVPSKNVFLLSS